MHLGVVSGYLTVQLQHIVVRVVGEATEKEKALYAVLKYTQPWVTVHNFAD